MNFPALIPPSTTKVERSFSLTNFVSIKLLKRFRPENLVHCMHISKYPHDLSDTDYEKIYCIWFSAEDIKSGSCKVAANVKVT